MLRYEPSIRLYEATRSLLSTNGEARSSSFGGDPLGVADHAAGDFGEIDPFLGEHVERGHVGEIILRRVADHPDRIPARLDVGDGAEHQAPRGTDGDVGGGEILTRA